jgi:FkbM family methyltransferase
MDSALAGLGRRLRDRAGGAEQGGAGDRRPASGFARQGWLRQRIRTFEEPGTGWRRRLRRPVVGFCRALGHLPFLFDAQERLLWFLRDRFDWPRPPFDIAFRGYRYQGDTDDVIDCNVYYFGAFEWWVVMLLDDLVRRLTDSSGKPVLYDIGANTGHHSLYVAGGVRRIYAFEPYEPALKKFRQRIAINRLTHIELLPLGLGDEDGEANYYAPDTVNRGTGSFLAGTNSLNSRAAIRLPVMRGDRVVEERVLLAPDIVKLDVEGSEKLVLRGLAETIRRHRPIILGELLAAGRWLFGDEAGLRAALYPDCVLLEVARRKPIRGYRLRRFDFATSDQFLCIPRERAAELGLARFVAG